MDIPLEARNFFEHPDVIKIEDDLTKVSESARLAFALMEPWQQVSCIYEPGFVKSTIDQVVDQANNYYSAITASLETAQDGSLVAQDAITLCNMIFSGTDTVENVTTFLKDMLELANKGHTRAEATTSQFRAIRGALFQISKSISNEIYIADTTPSKDEGDPLNVHFIELPDAIFLPEGKFEDVGAVMDRNTVPKSFKEIMAQLTQLNRDLTKLIDYIGGFVNWWMGMVTKLEALQKVVPQIRLDRSNPIRSDDVRRRWGEVQGQYDAYSRHVKAIQDSYRTIPSNQRKRISDTPRSNPDTKPHESITTISERGENVAPAQPEKKRCGLIRWLNSCSGCIIM